MSLSDMRKELKNVRKESCPMAVSRMSKVAIATELERHKHTKMPAMKEAITDRVAETLRVKPVEALKAPAKEKKAGAKKVEEVALPIPTAQKAKETGPVKMRRSPAPKPAMPSKMMKAVTQRVEQAETVAGRAPVSSKLVKGSQEARDRMNAVRAMKKKTA